MVVDLSVVAQQQLTVLLLLELRQHLVLGYRDCVSYNASLDLWPPVEPPAHHPRCSHEREMAEVGPPNRMVVAR
jgi:hypothetical protein